jgi:hypothetical protein
LKSLSLTLAHFLLLHSPTDHGQFQRPSHSQLRRERERKRRRVPNRSHAFPR